jgi:hypothetical protein
MDRGGRVPDGPRDQLAAFFYTHLLLKLLCRSQLKLGKRRVFGKVCTLLHGILLSKVLKCSTRVVLCEMNLSKSSAYCKKRNVCTELFPIKICLYRLMSTQKIMVSE